jgi:hypothetical protein
MAIYNRIPVFMNKLSQRITLIISLLMLFFTLVSVTAVVFIKFIPASNPIHQNQISTNSSSSDGDDIVDEGTEIAAPRGIAEKNQHHSGSGFSPSLLIIGFLVFALMVSVGLNFVSTRYFIKTIEKILSRNPSNVHIQTTDTPMIEKSTKDLAENEIRPRKEDEEKTESKDDDKKS